MSVCGYLYPGQGSQKVGMGKEFYSQVISIRPLFETAEKATGLKLLRLCFYGPAEDLNNPLVSELCVFLIDVITAEVLKHKRLRPQAQFGAGAGLYAALVVAEVLTLTEAVGLLKQRVELIQEEAKKYDSVMIQIVGLTDSELEHLLMEVQLEGRLEIAFKMADKYFTLAGERNALKKFIGLAKAYPECKAQGLVQGAAYHSSLLDQATDKMRSLVQSVRFQPIKISTINPGKGEYFNSVDEVKKALCEEFTHAVDFEKGINRLKQDGCFTMVETGPGQMLGQLVRRIDRGIRILNCEDAKSLALTLKLAE